MARSMKPGSQQHGQYKAPSMQPGSADGSSCHALCWEPESELALVDEPDYEFDDPPDSALGPLR
jgi:hypothetical protein